MRTITGLAAILLMMTLCGPAAFAADQAKEQEAATADQAKQTDVLAEQAAKVAPEVKADILTLMELTGSANMGQMMGLEVAQQVAGAYQQSHPNMPPEAMNILKEVLVASIKAEGDKNSPLMNALVPVYAKYYTPEELKALLKFYQSPVGKKSVEIMPTLSKEAMLVGRQYSQILGRKMIQQLEDRFKAENIVLDPPAENATSEAPAEKPGAKKTEDVERDTK